MVRECKLWRSFKATIDRRERLQQHSRELDYDGTSL